MAMSEPLTDIWYGTDGPRDAEIVFVAEAWGAEEFNQKKPLVGSSGRIFDGLLAESGIQRKEVLITNTISERPYGNDAWRYFYPRDEAPAGSEVRGLHPLPRMVDALRTLESQISSFPRRLIVTTGNYPLWALTSHTGYHVPAEAEGRRVPNGIMNWRGSMTYSNSGVQLLPIIHPAAIMRQWSLRSVTVHDLKARVPMALRGDWRPNPEPIFWAPPTFEQAKGRLEFWLRKAQSGPLRLAVDIETNSSLMTCIGFADSINFAMSIPFVKKDPLTRFASWWTTEQEARLVYLIRELLAHPNTWVEGQNFLYDTQYIQHFWGVTPNIDFDTMHGHHLLWPGTPKGLDYISSLYCRYHWYWKEDAKEWDTKGTVEQHLLYNCMDCVRTYEAADVLRKLIPQMGMDKLWERRKAHAALALRMMNRGTAIDLERKKRLSLELQDVLFRLDSQLLRIIPQSWLPPPKKGTKQSMWYTSSKQKQYLFRDLLGMKLPKNRKSGADSLGKESIEELRKKHPEFTRLFDLLQTRASVAVFKSHFVDARLDWDKRMRCYFNPAGTETFRWNSAENAFGRGTNLQNLPTGDEE